MMKKPWIVGLLLLSLAFLSARSTVRDGYWVIGNQTQLIIHGQTNVNTFKCKMAFYNKLDTLAYTTDNDGCMIMFKENKMNIPVTTFDCENKMINKDFYQVLQSDKHPYVQIQFVALERWTGTPHIGGTAYITLAGVTKPFIIEYQVNSNSKLLLLKGQQKINFSDFGLSAPQKMMGLIRVEDSLEVEFHLALQAI